MKSLLDTGYFEFRIVFDNQVVSTASKSFPYAHKERQRDMLVLCYTPASQSGGDGAVGEAKVVTWQQEQIEDFTRKLGFLEEGQNNKDHSKFQRLSTVSTVDILQAIGDLYTYVCTLVLSLQYIHSLVFY